MTTLNRLIAVMQRLRHPQEGCPWDRAQSLRSLTQYTIEEAYEVVNAIESDSMHSVCDELGDLLFQVVFYAQIASEKGDFDINDVISGITDKLIRRHPHVFEKHGRAADGDQRTMPDWEAMKAGERDQSARDRAGVLDGLPLNLPALMRASKLQRRAATVGFDWEDISGPLNKVLEEYTELVEAQADSDDSHAVFEEMGDLLFACVNLARHLKIDAESALRAANDKFERRFNYIELTLATDGRRFQDLDLAELDAIWNAAKLEGY